MNSYKLLKKFEKIYNETYDSTLKYILCKCSILDDVDDIIQETYLELYRILKEKKEILNYQAYIISIAKNKIIKYYTTNQKVKTISIFQETDNEESTIDLESGIDIESEFITKDNIHRIWNYISSINTDVAKIFYLHFALDMTYNQISKELGINESTVKSSLHRMLKRIKESYVGGEKNEQ